MPKAKAAGWDGLAPADLDGLPPLCWDRMAHVLNAVECTGSWPSQLGPTVVVLIPKAGGGQADRRPIALLSLLYRLWAKARVREVGQWIQSWDPQPVGHRAGALEQARDLALACDRAAAHGSVVAGIALDWAKCYDGVSLPLVSAALKAVGWPEQ